MKSLARVSAALLLGWLLQVPAHADDGNQTLYNVRNLVSDGALPAAQTDPNLVNAWGIAFNPWGPVWVADNETAVATLYDGAGNIVNLVVAIAGGENPTGIVFNGSTLIRPKDFVVGNAAATGPAIFLFATEGGTIAGWAPNVDFTHTFNGVDNSAKGAIYKGLALSAGGSGSLLYATDFHNGRIDVFDASFAPVKLDGKFVDPGIPAGYAPFGIQAIGGDLYVTYAKQDADRKDDVHGRGLGFVDVFDPNGHLVQRVATRGALNAPWGLAVAPAGFGQFAGRLLVGNFGDGRINAYDLASGQFVGTMMGANDRPVHIDGLWGLAFGNGFLNQHVNTLYFTAGPNDEANGLYGRILPTRRNGQVIDE